MIFNDMNLCSGKSLGAVVVTITGRSSTIQYDGVSHSISNYTYSINNPEYTVNDFTFTGTATASGTNVGTYSMGLSASQFTNTNPRFKDVTFLVTDGFVKITGKPVTVTAIAKSKTYDNNSSTDPALTATVSGTLGTDTVTYTISRASGQNAGEYTITPTGSTVQGNYTVSYVTAKFTINPASVTLTANSGTKTYSGSSQSVSGFTASVSGLTFASTVNATGSGTNAGTYNVTFSGVTINTTKDTTGNYVVTGTTNGTLTINPASVTLTANSGTYTYDGSTRTVSGFTASVSGLTFASTVKASGSGKNAGTYNVTFSGVTVNTTKDTTGNYVVTGTTNGTITINKAAASKLGLSVSAYSGWFDGENHSVSVSVQISSGTTLQYRASTSDSWSNTKPSYSTGTHTTYVRAVNSNYETATANAKVTIDSSRGAILFVSSAAADVSLNRFSDNYEIWRDTINAGNTILQAVPADTYWAINNTRGLIISARFTVSAGQRVTLNV